MALSHINFALFQNEFALIFFSVRLIIGYNNFDKKINFKKAFVLFNTFFCFAYKQYTILGQQKFIKLGYMYFKKLFWPLNFELYQYYQKIHKRLLFKLSI